MDDVGAITTIASIIAGFGAAMLFFRIQRELQMAENLERIWIPVSDVLLIGATLISLLLTLLPLMVIVPIPGFAPVRLARASCAASILLLAGYVPSILAHYRIILGARRRGPRDNPEPAERTLAALTVSVAALA